MKIYLILVSICALAACGGEKATPLAGNQVLKAANDSANLTPNNPLPANAAPNVATLTNSTDKKKIKTFDGKGVITKINTEVGSVELKHDEIKGLMPAMQMEFYVSDKKMLDGLKVGDAADFVLEDNAGAEQIISIKHSRQK